MAGSPPFLLVHSPLVGPETWQSTAQRLRHNGYRVLTPTLSITEPPYHRGLVEAAAVAEGAVLVAHSGAGALLPAIAARTRAKAAIYVDALPPHPGRSWFDTVPPQLQARLRILAVDGVLPPWHEWFPPDALTLPDGPVRDRFLAEIPRVPLAYFDEPAPHGTNTPSGYIQLSDAYQTAAAEAERRGWWVHREMTHHLAMLTEPSRVADLITQGWDRLAGAPAS